VGEELERWHKAIPTAKEQAQSRALLWVTGTLLVLAALAPPLATFRLGLPLWRLGPPLIFSAGFAVLVWALRAATPGAAIMGFLICFILAQSGEVWTRFLPYPASRPAVMALIVLFVLTFAATRFRRRRKEAAGLYESRRGRQASQIVANLSVAALFAAAGQYNGCIAALAEATADTVSSEVGQAVGGPARLLTSWRSVPAGTDGGITLIGTIAGLAGAALIVAIGMPRQAFPNAVVVWFSACAGLFFDSLLGATIERSGLIGNDMVNFSSTLFAAVVATALS
jgi:uncharacterized protein (TIGR00297 family)